MEERYWRGFALEYGLELSDVEHFLISPTKSILEYIGVSNPQLTMRSFLVTLEKMNRRDLIHGLKEVFYRKILQISLRIL